MAGGSKQQRERAWRSTVKAAASYAGWEILLEIPDNAYRTLAAAGQTKDPESGKRTWTNPGLIETMQNIAGWPDLLLGHSRRRQMIAAELKVEGNDTSVKQVEKLATLAHYGIRAFVWFDTDNWHDIIDILEGRS